MIELLVGFLTWGSIGYMVVFYAAAHPDNELPLSLDLMTRLVDSIENPLGYIVMFLMGPLLILFLLYNFSMDEVPLWAPREKKEETP